MNFFFKNNIYIFLLDFPFYKLNDFFLDLKILNLKNCFIKNNFFLPVKYVLFTELEKFKIDFFVKYSNYILYFLIFKNFFFEKISFIFLIRLKDIFFIILIIFFILIFLIFCLFYFFYTIRQIIK